MAEASKKETAEKPVEKLDASVLVSVKNISDRTVSLSTGQLEAGEEGQATLAEASMLFDYLTITKVK